MARNQRAEGLSNGTSMARGPIRGSVRQLPSGRWQVRDGQRAYGTYLTQKAAEDVLRHLDEAPTGSKGRIPFGVFMERDFMPFQQTQVRSSSYTNDEIALRLRLEGFKHESKQSDEHSDYEEEPSGYRGFSSFDPSFTPLPMFFFTNGPETFSGRQSF